MEPFTPELLTILVLVCIIWAGITCLAVILGLIFFLCIKCSTTRRQGTTTYPIERRSLYATPSIADGISPVPSAFPLPNGDPKKRIRRENPPFNSTDRNRFDDSEYPNDKNNETIVTSDERPAYEASRHYRSLEPVNSLRGLNRQTPYPPGVLARERWMNANRLGAKTKY